MSESQGERPPETYVYLSNKLLGVIGSVVGALLVTGILTTFGMKSTLDKQTVQIENLVDLVERHVETQGHDGMRERVGKVESRVTVIETRLGGEK